jgi:hypothetical protein
MFKTEQSSRSRNSGAKAYRRGLWALFAARPQKLRRQATLYLVDIFCVAQVVGSIEMVTDPISSGERQRRAKGGRPHG